jgi:hypothetical protein
MIRSRASHKLEEVLLFGTAVVKGGITDTDIFHHNLSHKRNHPISIHREKGKRKKEIDTAISLWIPSVSHSLTIIIIAVHMTCRTPIVNRAHSSSFTSFLINHVRTASQIWKIRNEDLVEWFDKGSELDGVPSSR